jgi:hypothetical protein
MTTCVLTTHAIHPKDASILSMIVILVTSVILIIAMLKLDAIKRPLTVMMIMHVQLMIAIPTLDVQTLILIVTRAMNAL